MTGGVLHEGIVVVFARCPERGRVKTRLARSIGEGPTLTLYRAFLQDTLRNARSTGREVVLAHTPGPHFPEMALAHRCIGQHGDTVGDRIDHALADAAGGSTCRSPIVIIGADTPHLPSSQVVEALETLGRSPAVLGPSSRGGFYLLGFARRSVPIASAFDQGDEYRAVKEELTEAGLTPSRLEPFDDIDEVADLQPLMESAHPGDPDGPRTPHAATLEALRNLGLWTPSNAGFPSRETFGPPGSRPRDPTHRMPR